MSAEEFTGRGFAPGVVTGVRSFDVDKYGRLTGIHYKQVWKPGENVSECRKDDNTSIAAIYQAYANLNSFTYSYDVGYSKRRRAKPQITSSPKPLPKPLQHAFQDCTCGFYGYFDGSDDYHSEAKITGVVEAYGETVIGTRGFRAKKARIVALRIAAGVDGISEAFARKVARNYSGVALFGTFEQMVAEFPPDTAYEPSPSTDPNFWELT